MTTPKTVAGLHHITAVSGNPQENIDFYTGPLGQKLVKQTVNFDDPGTWHLYYGDTLGSPGTILTFFPFANAAPGRAGAGAASAFAYLTAPGAIDGWLESLKAAGIPARDAGERFGQRVIALQDPHGQPVEIIGDPAVEGSGAALQGFHSTTLWVADPAPTARILTGVFGYEEAGHERQADGERLRFAAPGDGRGRFIDIYRADGAPRHRPGSGTIHHIAFRAEDDAMQDSLREALIGAGMQVTPRIDRQYFNAIYFREPGGVLFEVATDPPGFAVDEPQESLGRTLKLPPQYEAHREEIMRALPPIALPA
ncbi:ring-cleaving dioxygenase [Rhodobacteraceae bacterium WD3A24]|nr:ring-cleaving dioxygenase [Rhodobacteraceae bacterium WD3A24]